MDSKYVYVEIRIYVFISRISTYLYGVIRMDVFFDVFFDVFDTRVNIGALWGFVADIRRILTYPAYKYVYGVYV